MEQMEQMETKRVFQQGMHQVEQQEMQRVKEMLRLKVMRVDRQRMLVGLIAQQRGDQQVELPKEQQVMQRVKVILRWMEDEKRWKVGVHRMVHQGVHRGVLPLCM